MSSEDFRITDEDARSAFVEENYDWGTSMSEQEVVSDMSLDITMSAVDLSKISELDAAVNEFVLALENADQSSVAAAKSYAQSFTSVFDKGIPDSFIDLGSFVELAIDETGNADVFFCGSKRIGYDW